MWRRDPMATRRMGAALLLALWFGLLVRGVAAQPPVARAVLFTSPLCTFCREIVDEQLPPLLQPFGEQVEILYVNVDTEAGYRLYLAALEAFQSPRGVPLVFIGTDYVMGINIPKQFPGLVERYLAQGGVDWPSIPGLEEYRATQTLTAPATPEVAAATPARTPLPPGSPAAPPTPLVRAVLFWLATCPHCHEVLEQVLPPLQAEYGQQLEIYLIELKTSADSALLYQIAEGYGLPPERVGVPFLVIGDQALIGSRQIADQLPGLIEHYLAQGGVDWPAGLTPPPQAVFFSLAEPGQSETPPATPTSPAGEAHATRPSGFGLAMAVMILMLAALLYSLIAFLLGKTFSLPPWADWLIPALIVTGAGVAGYLAYVEVNLVEAVCGPVGDCNAVQASPYARLFGVLPVGLFGLAGYLALLIAWSARRFLPRLRSLATLSFFAMALFGTLFSVYLTWLEISVIRAICLWCLSSAVIMTLLLLLSLPATRNAGSKDSL